MVTTVGVIVGEALSDIIMNAMRLVVNLEYDCEKYWIKSLGEGWQTQSVDQWVECITRIMSEY